MNTASEKTSDSIMFAPADIPPDPPLTMTNTTHVPTRSKPLKIRPTSPIRQSFALPSDHFFTGSLFDSIVIFLQKYSIEWHDIQCVARGVHPDSAVPTICISVKSPPDMNYVVKLWKEYIVSGSPVLGSLEDMVPNEIAEVEFARVFADLLPVPVSRNIGGNRTAMAGVGGSIASLVTASLKSAAAGRSEVSLVSCVGPSECFLRALDDNLQDGDWSGIGDDEGKNEGAVGEREVQ